MTRLLAALTICVALAAPLLAAETITIDGLLDDMTNLGRLAEFPDPYYTEKQFSSYDRASKSPTEGWFANNDATQYLRIEERNGEKECVLMDADGPGAIVRIWSASAERGGTLRIYIDGNLEPALEHNMQELMEAKHPAFPSPLSGRRSQGWNLYFPIPYQTHCKVTATATPAFYYQINYRTYPAGTKIEPFTIERALAAKEKVQKIADQLANPADPILAEAATLAIDQHVPPGGRYALPAIEGPRAIRLLTLKVDSDELYEALRKCVLRIRFDNEEEPCLEAPVGDFFGSAPGLNPYNSLPLSVAEDGTMTSRWVMPFRRTADIELTNYGDVPVKVTGAASSTAYDWTRNTLHFHARWRIEEGISTNPPRDWTILRAIGKGRYVGNMLSIANPSVAWWGEGDEKIYVDGETFPSTFGTGTEDYYGYAYCSNQTFFHAYHNQTLCDGPRNFGRACVNRFHVIDDIPFQSDFKFDIEIWHWDRQVKIPYATTAYWYAERGSTSAFEPLTADNTPVTYKPELPRIEGAIEGEELEQSQTAGRSWNDFPGPPFSAGYTAMWGDMKEGDTKTFVLPVEKAGWYALIGVFDCDMWRGIFSVSVNGAPGAQEFDTCREGRRHPVEIDLGTFDFRAGNNEVVFTYDGKSEKAKREFLGIDCFRLIPSQAAP